MEKTSVLLVCILVACSVWIVRGRTIEISIDDQEQGDVEMSVEVGKLPGLCWACKWALNKVKKDLRQNLTPEKVEEKLKTVCNKIGLLKSVCKKFVAQHLGELIEELTTTDNVKTICVNTKACKSKEVYSVFIQPGDNDPQPELDVF